MDLSPSTFTTHNVHPSYKLPDNLEYFSLTAPPNTRICRKASTPDETTAPMMLTRLTHPLVLAEVTLTASFSMEWDQAGLIVFTGPPPPLQTIPLPAVPIRRRRRGNGDVEEGKWVKAGLEFTGGAMNASSVVATSASGGDWCLSPLMGTEALDSEFEPVCCSLRIKFERIGDALWIWYRDVRALHSESSLEMTTPEVASAAWRKMREVNGFFRGVEMKGDVWVGCYASRPVDFVAGEDWDERFGMPESGEGRGLMVEFEDLEIL